MDATTLAIFFLVLTPVVIQAWQAVDRRPARDLRRDPHYLAKRHMLPRDSEKRRRPSTQTTKEMRKKPSGHLKPLMEEEMENDEVVSVAIGPPAMRPKYEKGLKYAGKINRSTFNNTIATNLVKDVLFQLGREFLSHNVNEDFVFGQYVGSAMKNLSSALKLRMQHDVLDLIMKYQKINKGDAEPKILTSIPVHEEKSVPSLLKDLKIENKTVNETEEGWPDFSNLEKYVGDHDRNLNLDVSKIDVYFYDFTRNDVETFTIENAAKGILGIKELDKTRQFIIFVAGYKSNINKRTEERVRDTFRNYPNSYLIILDHSQYTNDKQGNIKSYERSVKYVHYIGKALAHMLVGLAEGNISPKNMHCIGHSLGSQILGQAGEIFYDITGSKIVRITALDPAGPCFSNSLIQEQVRSGVADYVEVYHCNAGGLGTTSVLGDVDFFMNKNGQSQPKCGTPFIPGVFDSSKAAKCNHRACIDIWTATVGNPSWFLSWKCNSYKVFKGGQCAGNDVTIAGFWSPGNATGVYYFSTDGYDI